MDFYWDNYQYWTMTFLQLPYVISMVLLSLITILGDFKEHYSEEREEKLVDEEHHDLGFGVTVLIWIACILSYILILYEIVQACIQKGKYFETLNNIMDPIGQICFAIWSTCHLQGIHMQQLYIPAITLAVFRGMMTFFKMFE
jgi:hypothetical protein